MWNVRAVVESAVEHTKRILLHFQRRQVGQVHQPKGFHGPEARHKLSKWPGEGCAGVGRQVADCSSYQSNTSSNASGVVSRLRPVTSRLVQGFVRKVSAPLWSEAKRRATKRLVFGESAPYFALVGVTLVSGSQQGLVTKEDELEALCSNIREAISRAGWLHDPEYWQHQKSVKDDDSFEILKEEHTFSLADFKLGSVIDKGCNAVVYTAKWNVEEENVSPSPPLKRQRSESPLPLSKSSYGEGEEEEIDSENFQECESTVLSRAESEIFYSVPEELENVAVNMSSISADHLGSVSSLLDVDALVLSSGLMDRRSTKKVKFKQEENRYGTNSTQHTEALQGAVARPPHPTQQTGESSDDDGTSMEEYPLAVKMMFNYEAESNAPAILRAMYKELLPTTHLQLDDCQMQWQDRLCGKQIRLPPHLNIVDMPCVFVDRVPFLEDSMQLYPDALPARLNPRGSGRNMSLFCVMRRYDMSLREYIASHEPPSHTSLLLLTQLLEGVLHINHHGVAHRDLKSDNILLSLREGWQYPQLVLTDFGCSLTSESSNMTVPFPCYEADARQGNAALMAPEVKSAIPGLLRYIDFSKSDLWAAGALAYEIYGLENPFFPVQQTTISSRKKLLDSASYKESQLPRLPKGVPSTIRHLISDLLRRNPRNRPNANIAATLCQLVLWAPSKWLCRRALTLPSHSEITQWLLCLTTKVLCEAQLSEPQTRETKRKSEEGRKEQVKEAQDRQGGQLEYHLVSTFLARVHYIDIIQAIKWNRAF